MHHTGKWVNVEEGGRAMGKSIWPSDRLLKKAHLRRCPQVRLCPAHQLAGVAEVAPYSSRRHSQDFACLREAAPAYAKPPLRRA